MRPIRVSLAALGVSEPLPMDHYIGPFNVGIGCVVEGGSTLTFSVQHTFDDVYDENFDPATAAWFNNAGITGSTASTDGNYAFPVTAIRLNVTAFTAGSVEMTVVQAGRAGGC